MKNQLIKLVLGSSLAVGLAGPVLAQDKVADELAKYREALADGNPADLLEVRARACGLKNADRRMPRLSNAILALGRASWRGRMPSCPNTSRIRTR